LAAATNTHCSLTPAIDRPIAGLLDNSSGSNNYIAQQQQHQLATTTTRDTTNIDR